MCAYWTKAFHKASSKTPEFCETWPGQVQTEMLACAHQRAIGARAALEQDRPAQQLHGKWKRLNS